MRVPKIMFVGDVGEYLGDSRSPYRLTTSTMGRAVLSIPLRSYVVQPYSILRVSGSDISVVKRVDLDEAVADLSQELRTPAGKVVVKPSLRTPREVCFKGRCQASSEVLATSIEDKVVVAWRVGKVFYVTNPVAQSVDRCSDVALYRDSEGPLAAILVRGRGGCSIIMWDRFEGVVKTYSMDCRSPLNLTCSRNVCVASVRDRSYVVTFNHIYELPLKLSPLISCGKYDYLYDERNKLVVRSDTASLDPVMLSNHVDGIGCLEDGSLMVCSGGSIGIVRGNVWSPISFEARRASASSNVVMYEQGSVTRVNVVGEEGSLIATTGCVVDGNGFVWCVKGGELMVLDPHVTYEPLIKVLKASVSHEGYAEVEVRPWHGSVRIGVEGKATIVNITPKGDSAVVALKPRRLGWSGGVRVTAEGPTFKLARVVDITSSPPSVGRLEVSRCLYAPTATLADGESNTSIEIRALITNPSPEEAELEVVADGIKVVNGVTLPVPSGTNWVLIGVKGRALRDIVRLGFRVRYGRDSYNVGESLINLGRHLIPDPLKDIRRKVSFINGDGSTIVRVSDVSGVALSVTCSNGVHVEGVNELVVKDCALPAVLAIEYVKEGFKWVRRLIIEQPPLIKVLSGTGFSVDASLKGVNGFLVNSVSITTSRPSISIDLRGVRVSNNVATVRIRVGSSQPVLAVAACDGYTSTSAGVSPEVLLTCPTASLLKGVSAVVLYPVGEPLVKYFGVSELVRVLTQVAYRAALSLSTSVGVR